MSLQTSTQTDSCAKCTYWNAKTGKTAGTGETEETGECRRQPPQAISFKVDSETKFETRFPITAASEWCGEFKAQ